MIKTVLELQNDSINSCPVKHVYKLLKTNSKQVAHAVHKLASSRFFLAALWPKPSMLSD